MQPLVFEPYFRPQIWGDRRLELHLGKALPAQGTFGESWELSAHPHHVSRVAEGPLRGARLTELWKAHAEDWTGGRVSSDAPFPLLIKYLDCHELLSVQVHPDDKTAQELLKGESGKTEAWVVLHAESASRIFAGLQPGVTRDELERHLDRGTVADCLHSFVPRVGDCVFVPAGLVHAAGGGVVLAEVQQSSDATFRLFDWNRLDPDSKPRALHRDEALRAIDWSAGPVQPVVPTALTGHGEGAHGERLVNCPYFCLERYIVDRAIRVPHAGRLSIWMLLAGTAELASDDGYRRKCRMGETVLIPASAGPVSWNATPLETATLLCVTIP